MKTIIAIAMCFSFLGLFGQPEKSFKSVGVAEFAKAVADTSFLVLDVRTMEEYLEGHIPDADFNIDVLKDDFEKEALKVLPKDKSVALYCRSGNRSKTAARVLAENGYEVVGLSSGFRGWVAADKPVE